MSVSNVTCLRSGDRNVEEEASNWSWVGSESVQPNSEPLGRSWRSAVWVRPLLYNLSDFQLWAGTNDRRSWGVQEFLLSASDSERFLPQSSCQQPADEQSSYIRRWRFRLRITPSSAGSVTYYIKHPVNVESETGIQPWTCPGSNRNCFKAQ